MQITKIDKWSFHRFYFNSSRLLKSNQFYHMRIYHMSILNLTKLVFFFFLYQQSYQESIRLMSQKNIQFGKIQIIQSPRFGKVQSKAGMYGQPQTKFIQQSKSNSCNSNAVITKQQLSKHNTVKSAWISLKGVVYDVTKYISHHPGGDTLLEGCGKQSQKLFNQHHSWVNAKNILAHCVIGTLKND